MSARPLWQRRLARLAALGAVGIAIVLLLAAKGTPPTGAASAEPVAQQALDRALAAGEPTLAFFHSTTCDSCIEMMAVIDEVYPAFRDTVTLVDVDVYDPANEALLDRTKIAGIPTVILYDRTGEPEWRLGVMAADELRARLTGLAGG